MTLRIPQNTTRAWISTGRCPCYQECPNSGLVRWVKSFENLTISRNKVNVSSYTCLRTVLSWVPGGTYGINGMLLGSQRHHTWISLSTRILFSCFLFLGCDALQSGKHSLWMSSKKSGNFYSAASRYFTKKNNIIIRQNNIIIRQNGQKQISPLYFFFTYENRQKIFWSQPAKKKRKLLVLLIFNLNRTFV